MPRLPVLEKRKHATSVGLPLSEEKQLHFDNAL